MVEGNGPVVRAVYKEVRTSWTLRNARGRPGGTKSTVAIAYVFAACYGASNGRIDEK
jgi:hypothetical protein